MHKPITLITGTRKGIGQALANYYVAQGHEVIGCSRSAIDWKLDGYTHFTADVTDEVAIKRMFASIRKTHGRLDNLINNAGIASMNHALLTPLATVNKILNTNVVGTFLLCREAAKLMGMKKYGRIVNFSTVAVPLKIAGEAIYAASKAAVQSLTEVLAHEFAEMGITINAIGPTPIETDLIASVPEDKLKNLISKQAVKRMGTQHDVINVVDFFLQQRSDFITGQTIYLGGV